MGSGQSSRHYQRQMSEEDLFAITVGDGVDTGGTATTTTTTTVVVLRGQHLDTDTIEAWGTMAHSLPSALADHGIKIKKTKTLDSNHVHIRFPSSLLRHEYAHPALLIACTQALALLALAPSLTGALPALVGTPSPPTLPFSWVVVSMAQSNISVAGSPSGVDRVISVLEEGMGEGTPFPLKKKQAKRRDLWTDGGVVGEGVEVAHLRLKGSPFAQITSYALVLSLLSQHGVGLVGFMEPGTLVCGVKEEGEESGEEVWGIRLAHDQVFVSMNAPQEGREMLQGVLEGIPDITIRRTTTAKGFHGKEAVWVLKKAPLSVAGGLLRILPILWRELRGAWGVCSHLGMSMGEDEMALFLPVTPCPEPGLGTGPLVLGTSVAVCPDYCGRDSVLTSPQTLPPFRNEMVQYFHDSGIRVARDWALSQSHGHSAFELGFDGPVFAEDPLAFHHFVAWVESRGGRCDVLPYVASRRVPLRHVVLLLDVDEVVFEVGIEMRGVRVSDSSASASSDSSASDSSASDSSVSDSSSLSE